LNFWNIEIKLLPNCLANPNLMMKFRLKNIFWVMLFLAHYLPAQEKPGNETAVESIDRIVNAAYEIIPGGEGKVRDCNRFRAIYLPTVKCTILCHASDPFPFSYESVALEEPIGSMQGEYCEKGCTQWELGRGVNKYNSIVNVFQGFYAKDSEKEEAMGGLSYQLLYFDDRCWISDVLWTTDTNGTPVPQKYLET
jgi:hypothetical protein